MGFFFHRGVRVIESLFIGAVIIDDRIIDYGRCTVVIDYSRLIYVRDAHVPIVVYAVKIVLIYDNSMTRIGVISYVNVNLADVGNDYVMTASPTVVAVIRLAWGKRYPPHVTPAVNP